MKRLRDVINVFFNVQKFHISLNPLTAAVLTVLNALIKTKSTLN